MNKTLLATIGTTVAAASAGYLAGVSPDEVAVAAGAAGAVSGIAMKGVSDSTQLEPRDVAMALLPTVASAVVTGLTYGWQSALLALITGPLASILRTAVEPKMKGVPYH